MSLRQGPVNQSKRSAKVIPFLEGSLEGTQNFAFTPFLWLATLMLLQSLGDDEGKAKKTGRITMHVQILVAAY